MDDTISPLQGGKVLEKMIVMEKGNLYNLDGSGYFFSVSRILWPPCFRAPHSRDLRNTVSSTSWVSKRQNMSLKNQDLFGHNFDPGKQHLREVFVNV